MMNPLSAFIRKIPVYLSLPLAFVVGSTAVADDLSVYTGGINAASRPNILFVLDYSGSMGNDVNGNSNTSLPSKESILEQAVNNLLAQNADKINAGISIYSNTSSGIKWPVSDLQVNASTIDPNIPAAAGLTSADIISGIMANESAGGWTATVSALTEAALYYQGGTVSGGGVNTQDIEKFRPQTWNTGSNSYTGGSWNAANPVTYTPSNAFQFGGAPNTAAQCNDHSNGGGSNHCGSVSNTGSCTQIGTSGQFDSFEQCTYSQNDSWAGANYNSPITQDCQENYIVLISDGDPTVRWDYPELTNLLGHAPSACEDLSNSIFSGGQYAAMGNCGPEIVWQLANNDQVATIENSTVKTFTIGFGIGTEGADYLERLADDGDATYYQANDSVQLVQSLNDAIDDILGGSENFAELSIDVNKANFANDNRVFFPLFSPSRQRSWEGNLKGYFIDTDGIKDITNTLATVTDAQGTRFADTATSFWSETPAGVALEDGNEVMIGGASGKLASTSRNLYTFSGTTIPALGEALIQSDGRNLLEVGNNDVTAAMLGASNAAERSDLIDWLHAAPMGAPLHSKSTTLRYPNQTVVYVMTNQGLLHAFDATSPTNPLANDTTGGEELFAFMPPELLTNLPALRTPNVPGPHIYGLDGGMTRWHDDDNNNGIVDGNETVQLIFGMRRGGNNYYSLDVTDPANPKYMWKISGGQGDFANLAQTWSRPALISVMNGTTKERVLVFGGGYDANVMDTATTRQDADGASGNAVYMVNRNGQHIWTATHADMDFGIPANINIIDSDNDNENIADRMYFGDLGGQVWRVDFGNIDNTTANFTVEKLADLGTDSFQPFFYSPSVALGGSSGSRYISVALGAGHRANPMDASTQNRLFMVKDRSVDGPLPSDFTTIITSDLHDASADNINSSDAQLQSDAQTELKDGDGWFIQLASGEKSLSSPVTFEGRLLATTFLPIGSGSNTDTCSVASTQGRYYELNISTASAAEDPNAPDDPSATTPARSKVISARGIPSSPVVVFPPGTSDVQIVVDKNTVSTVNQRLDRVMWHPRD